MSWIALGVAVVLLAGVGIGTLWRSKTPSSLGKGGGMSVPERVQLAVLPASGATDSDDSAFNDGLVETLTSRLTTLTEKHPLAVIPASEVRARKVATVDAARAEFGVNLGLVINVQHAEGQERVNYSLVDATTHQQLRGGTITVPRGDPFALQDQVSESVAQALELELQPQEKRTLEEHGTMQPAAYDFYLQGRGYLQDYVKLENVENAIKVFNHALEKDPAFAAANAGLGEAYWRKYELTHDKEWAGAAINNCQKGAERDPALAAAHICLGSVFVGTGNYEKALEEFRRGMELEPTNDSAHAGLAYVYEHLDQLDAAEKAFKQAIAMRPNYWATYNRLGVFYQRHARYEEAAALYLQVVSLAPDSFTGYYNVGGVRILQGRYAEAIPLLQRSLEIRKTADATSNLGTAYFQLHRYADAAAAYEQATQLDPRNYVLWGNLGDAYYWATGRRADAMAAYGKGIALAEEKLRVNPRDAEALRSLAVYHAMRGERKPALDNLGGALRLNPKGPGLLFNAGIVYQQLGDTQRALDALERAVAAGISPATLRDTPNFDDLRANPRYLKLIQGSK
jgi:serine/threonine-protein kinase